MRTHVGVDICNLMNVDVGTAYNNKRALGLTAQEIADLAQYLKSL